ncbi:MAG: hypothetical protein JNK64_12455 [Myxococcales bacterium]|nr:hypothetical protein [Myxococcales bacterium]
MKLWLLAALLAGLAATGCGVTYGVGAGNALVAPGTTSGTTGTIKLIDRGGPVSRLVLRTIAAYGAAASAIDSSSTTTTVSTHTECYGSSCQRVEVTDVRTTYVIDPAKAAQAQRDYERLDEAISNTPYRGFPFETILEISSRDLGGDTSGWMFWYWFHATPRRVGPVAVGFSAGFGTGSLDFHDRTRTTLVGDSTNVAPVEAMVTPEHFYLGTPVRVSVYARNNLWFYLQPDLNWASVFEDWFAVADGSEDIEANPWRLGARLRLKGFELGAELLTDGMSAQSRTLSAEAGYVF